MTGFINEFKSCLSTMSYSRAGWDYQMPLAQRAEENKAEKEALSRAREIWANNPDLHDALINAFREIDPLASLSEIRAA